MSNFQIDDNQSTREEEEEKYVNFCKLFAHYEIMDISKEKSCLICGVPTTCLHYGKIKIFTKKHENFFRCD